MYEPRTYRHWVNDSSLISFEVIYRETDLFIRATDNLESVAIESIKKHREPIEKYVQEHPLFLYTLEPYSVDKEAPDIVKEMAGAGAIAGVGPMAAVAGAIAEAVGRDLLPFSSEVIVENGGDIFMKIKQTRTVGVYAGENSPFTGKLKVEINPVDTPLGICTSSGTVGHSLSFGTADAVVVFASSTALADAVATAICNKIKLADDIDEEIKKAQDYEGIRGLIITKGDRIGIWGNIKLSV